MDKELMKILRQEAQRMGGEVFEEEKEVDIKK